MRGARRLPGGGGPCVAGADRYDRAFLANYAKLHLRDDLARVAGVADADFYGDTEPGKQIRLAIDRDRLAALGLTTSDVVGALGQQGLSAEAAPGGRLPTLTFAGRLVEPTEFKDIMLKSGKDGSVVRLGVVAQVRVAEGWGNTTRLDGKPAAIVRSLPPAGRGLQGGGEGFARPPGNPGQAAAGRRRSEGD